MQSSNGLWLWLILGIRIGAGKVKQLLVNIVQAPTLFSLDISNEFSVTTALAFIKK